MNKIWNHLNESQDEYKKIFDVSGKVNAERLQDAVVSVLFEHYSERTRDELEILYTEINVNTGKNKKNPMRNKITRICEIYGVDTRKKKNEFFGKIVDFLKAQISEDFVEGWTQEDYADNDADMSEDSDDSEEDEDGDEPVTDNSGFFVDGATEGGWG
jgi:hypothetical protein